MSTDSRRVPKPAAVSRQSIFDFHGFHIDTDAVTLAGEEAILAARNDDGGPAVRAIVGMETRAGYRHHGRSGLHEDQLTAAAKAPLGGNRSDAVVRPSGHRRDHHAHQQPEGRLEDAIRREPALSRLTGNSDQAEQAQEEPGPVSRQRSLPRKTSRR